MMLPDYKRLERGYFKEKRTIQNWNDTYRLLGKALLFIVLLISLPLNAFGSEIEWISIEDSLSYPLKDGDNGISFSYKTKSYGTVQRYLRINEKTFSLGKELKEILGKSIVYIRANRLSEIFNEEGFFNGSLIVSHISSRKNLQSTSFLPLSFWVKAPYGTSLKPKPTEPTFLRTDLTKKVTNPVGFLATVAGVIISAVGAYQFIEKEVKKRQEDKSEEENLTPDYLLLGGLIIVGIGYSRLYEYIPHIEKNRINEIENMRRKEKYETQRQKILEENERIRNTYYIKGEADDRNNF